MRSRLVLVMAGFLLAACGAGSDEPAGSGEPPTTAGLDSTIATVVEPDYGPFLADDPYDVVSGLEWLEGMPVLPGGPIAPDGPIAVLMDASTPETLHIAVNGGGCRPEVKVTVVQPPPALELGVSVGDYIVPPGLQCPDILTTHGFVLHLREPASLQDVVLNPMLSEAGEDIIVIQPGGGGPLPGEVWLTCPGGPSFPAKTFDQLPYNLRTDLALVEPPGLLEAMDDFLGSEEGRYWPQDDWRLLYRSDESVQVVHLDTATGALAFMSLEFADGLWRWAGSSQTGSCPLRIRMEDDLGVVTWRIDPEAEPLDPETTTIPVLVTEQGCAGGQEMGDRLVGPEVVVTDSEVLIVFGVVPSQGAQTCPSNPEQRVEVELPEPLGDRLVRDGMETGLDLGDFLR